MYINGVKVRIKKIQNAIELFLGICGLIVFGATGVASTLDFEYYTDSDYEILYTFYILTFISAFFIVKSIRARNFIGGVYFYSRYFEGDLDGKIKTSDMVNVIGKSEKKINSELGRLKRKNYMKNYKLVKDDKNTIVELESIVTKCQCRNCGAVIDKKVYFAGLCPYCGGLDVFAKQLKQEENKI